LIVIIALFTTMKHNLQLKITSFNEFYSVAIDRLAHVQYFQCEHRAK